MQDCLLVILRYQGGITVDYEDGFFNDNGSACIIINNSQETKFLEVHGRTVDVASNCISFLYGYNNWDIYPHTDIIYDYRLGDGDNVDANEDVQGKANEVLFDLINQGSYLVLRIKS